MIVAVVFLDGILCAGFAALLAHFKGRSVGGFALAGLLLGLIGLLWAAFARPVAAPTQRKLPTGARIERRRTPLGKMPAQRWPD